MPKATKSSKKTKYNARFPPARIKKIMQTDEEVGKVAAAVPVIISRALEMFIESLISETAKLTQAKNAKTLSTSHIKQTIKSTRQFDFLCDLVKNVPDHQVEDNNGDSAVNGEYSVKKGRGRPRKTDISGQGKKKREDGNKSSTDEDDEEDEEEETEDTETDEESTSTSGPWSANHPAATQGNSAPGAMPAFPMKNTPPTSFVDALRHSNNNNNNNNLPPLADSQVSTIHMPGVQNPPGSGDVPPHGMRHHDLSLGREHPGAQPPLPPPTHPYYPASSNYGTAPSLPPFAAAQGFHPLPPAHVKPPYPAPPGVPSPCGQQQQPIDLTRPSRQHPPKEDDDYDT